MVYSTLYEILVDFTRDYDTVRQALSKVEHYDKTCLENMLQAVKTLLLTNWGSQNYSQVLVFTDGGIGLGSTSLAKTIDNIRQTKSSAAIIDKDTSVAAAVPCLPLSPSSKISFILFGNMSESYFQKSKRLYQDLLDASGQKGTVFVPPVTTSSTKARDEIVTIKNENNDEKTAVVPSAGNVQSQMMTELVQQVCESSYKQFEAVLKCGGYAKLESAITIWPPPLVIGCSFI